MLAPLLYDDFAAVAFYGFYGFFRRARGRYVDGRFEKLGTVSQYLDAVVDVMNAAAEKELPSGNGLFWR